MLDYFFEKWGVKKLQKQQRISSPKISFDFFVRRAVEVFYPSLFLLVTFQAPLPQPSLAIQSTKNKSQVCTCTDILTFGNLISYSLCNNDFQLGKNHFLLSSTTKGDTRIQLFPLNSKIYFRYISALSGKIINLLDNKPSLHEASY